MDRIIANGTVVTVNRERQVLERHDVLVSDGKIARIGKNLAGKKKGAKKVIDATGMVVVPGFVHGHLHACQTLFRNRADGLELLDWLRERIWPFEAAHTARSMRASADLTFAELISGGSTAALDMGTVRHYDAVFESARDSGFRLTGGKAMMDHGQGLPAGLRETTADSIAESLKLLERWHGQRGRAAAVRVRAAVRALVHREAAPRGRRGSRRRTRCGSTPTPPRTRARSTPSASRPAWTTSPASTRSASRGPTSPSPTASGSPPTSTGCSARSGTCVCHCPSSNLKLASGYAKIPELLEAGVPVWLGADGAPCNNNLDMFTEMRLAALIHKPRRGPARDARRDGARDGDPRRRPRARPRGPDRLDRGRQAGRPHRRRPRAACTASPTTTSSPSSSTRAARPTCAT